jgi:hypothetical protein
MAARRQTNALDFNVHGATKTYDRASSVSVATDEGGRVHTVPEWWAVVLALANFGLLIALVAMQASIGKCRT